MGCGVYRRRRRATIRPPAIMQASEPGEGMPVTKASTSQKPAPFDTIIVHSFSRFFRDQFQLEFYVRRLAKNGIRLTSITQDLGDELDRILGITK